MKAQLTLLLIVLAALPALAADVGEPMPFDLLGPFVKLGDGSVLAMDDAKVHVSRDDGKTWTARPLFKDAGKCTAREERAVLRTRSGVVVIAFSNNKELVMKWDRKNNNPLPEHHNPVYVVRSPDDGQTWEEPRLVQDGYCGALRHMIQLRSGRIILGCQLAVTDPGRHVTFTLASDDDGCTWTPPVIVAKDPTAPGDTGPEHRLSYPYVYEHKPGEIWVTTGQGKLRMKLREADFLPTSGSGKSEAGQPPAR